MKDSFEQLLDCAVSAVKKAGLHALHNNSRRIQTIRTFKHDVKLVLDVECQMKAVNSILTRFPGHSILGEEGINQSHISETEYQWIIDPIDGTVNFSHGLPHWCSSVAVRQHDNIVAGAVYLPVTNELYTATINGPARKNGSIIHVSNVRKLANSIVMTGLDRHAEKSSKPLAVFRRISEKTQKARVMGAAAADICQVACGGAEGYYESGIYIWDIAAAGLIVERAGGRSEILNRNRIGNRMSFLASNGMIHSALKKLLPHNIKH